MQQLPRVYYRSDLAGTHVGNRFRPPAPRRLVRCFACERSEGVSSDDLQGYMQSGWPRCCGEVMTYFMEADRPDE